MDTKNKLNNFWEYWTCYIFNIHCLQQTSNITMHGLFSPNYSLLHEKGFFRSSSAEIFLLSKYRLTSFWKAVNVCLEKCQWSTSQNRAEENNLEEILHNKKYLITTYMV